MNAAYAALVRVAGTLKPRGFLASFETDLVVHDRACCERHPKLCFVWLVYGCGTHWMPFAERGARETRETVNTVRAIGANFDPLMAWFVWDGVALIAHPSLESVCEFLERAE